MNRPPDSYVVSGTWQERWGESARAMKHENDLLELVLFLNNVAAGCCVFAIMVTLVVRRSKDVGLLRCLGVSRMRVVGLFLLVGLMMGGVGVGLGIAGGLTLAGPLRTDPSNNARWVGGSLAPPPEIGGSERNRPRPRVDRGYEWVTGQPLYPPRLFGVDADGGLPIVIYKWKLALYAGVGLLVALLAAAYPAGWAACREPVAALREE